MIRTLSLLAYLLIIANCEDTVNFFGYAECNRGPSLIEKRVDVTYTYSLSSNIWTQFPDLRIDFELNQAQWVYIKYHIVTKT